MKRPHLLARCFEPVAMTEEALRVCIAVASGDEWFGEERAAALKAAGGLELLGPAREPMAVKDGVATIAIDGPLVRKASGVANVSGLTSYDAIRKDHRAAMADAAVKSVDFVIDSPGGDVSGLFETADEIFAARGRKPMRALVTQANSAAYVLAAAVGNIEIEQLGQAGSVGAMLAVRPPDAEAGPIRFYSSVSPLKNADPTTEDGRADYQARVDYAGQLLVEKVAAYRGVSVDKVKADFGRGAVLTGMQAVTAGLADRVGAANSTKGNDMDITRIAAAVGLDDKADENKIAERAAALVAFEAQVLAAAGATDSDTAIGYIRASATAIAELAAVRAEMATRAAADRLAAFRDSITAAVTSKRITPAALRDTVIPMLDEDNAAKAESAVAALPEDKAGTPEQVAAVCAAVALSESESKRVAAYLAKRPAAIVPPLPRENPEAKGDPLDERAQKIKKSADAARAQYGVSVKDAK